MMWFSCLLIFILVGGSFCEDDDSHEYQEECYMKESKATCDPSLLPTSYPENGDELLSYCLNLETFVGCVLDAMKTCKEEGDEREYAEAFVSYLRTLCQEDNPQFKVVSDNLQCVTRVAKKIGRRCFYSISEKNREAIQEITNPLLEGDQNDYDYFVCLFDAMELACHSTKYTHHCGEEVSDAIEEFITRAWLVEGLSKCTPEMLQEMEPLVDVYLEVFRDELEIEDTLKKRRK